MDLQQSRRHRNVDLNGVFFFGFFFFFFCFNVGGSRRQDRQGGCDEATMRPAAAFPVVNTGPWTSARKVMLSGRHGREIDPEHENGFLPQPLRTRSRMLRKFDEKHLPRPSYRNENPRKLLQRPRRAPLLFPRHLVLTRSPAGVRGFAFSRQGPRPSEFDHPG